VDYILKPSITDILRSKVSVFVDFVRQEAELRTQVIERRTAERELSRVQRSLEAKIRERLRASSPQRLLRKEVEMRRRAEAELHRANQRSPRRRTWRSPNSLAEYEHEIRTADERGALPYLGLQLR